MRVRVLLSSFTALFGLIVFSSSSYALKYDINSKTVWLVFQEERNGVSANLSPLYEFLSIRATDAGISGLEVNLSLWGEVQTLDWWKDEKTDGEILFGYLRYRNLKAGVDLKAGRIFVNSGGSALMEQLDGGYFSYTFKRGSRMEIFGGVQINDVNGSRKGDWMTGVRLSHRWNDRGEFGLSYLYQAERDDVNFNRVGVDGWYYFGPKFNLNGYLSYDITYSDVADTSLNFTYLPGIGIWKQLNIELGYRSPSAFLGNQSILSVFASGRYLDPRIKAVFITGGLRIIPGYEAMVYLGEGEHAHRISLRLCQFFKEGRYNLVMDVARLQLSDDVDYTELRGGFHGGIIDKLSTDLDVVWDLMDKKVSYGEEEAGYAISVVWSLSYEPLKWMKLSAGVSYSNGIESENEVKGLGKLEISL